MRSKWKFAFVAAVVAASVCGYLYGSRGIPFVAKYTDWSIRIYFGASPFDIGPSDLSPAITAADVSDIAADFVADPFLFKEGDTWHLFFEVLNSSTMQGDIAVATSKDLLRWDYKQVVLDEQFHLSFPLVFRSDGEIFMIPETTEANGVRLYRATKFPSQWEFVSTLMSGYHADPVVFEHEDSWWLFTSASPTNNVLRLYRADSLRGTWSEHPKSPIIYKDAARARPAGRVLKSGERLFRFAQDDLAHYGTRVRAFEILRLSKTDYAETELDWSTLRGSGAGWNAGGMHHVDLHPLKDGSWAASVDGWRISRKFDVRQ